MPLTIILAVQGFKELLEDRKRHMSDSDVNFRRTRVFRGGTFVSVRWCDLRVGELVKVHSEEYFPADLVLVSSSEPQSMCYVETANLDGETNLKIKQGHQSMAGITSTREARFFSGHVDCEPPNNRLYRFDSSAMFTSSEEQAPRTVPLTADQLLLRGAQLRNTPWVYGIAVYTGHDSKLLQNMTSAPVKRSNVDRVTNSQILGIFGALVVLAIITTVGNAFWAQTEGTSAWYLGPDRTSDSPFYNFITFIILYNMVIPISLMMTVDIVKYIQGVVFISNDLDMYDAETRTPARAVTSGLNEELGQVQYIFSDKTGTLTRNIMVLKQCSIAGVLYGSSDPDADGFHDPALLDHLTGGHPTASVIREWLTLLAVCHTVVPERDPDAKGRIVYQAASPDEAALVQGVKALGFSFNSRRPDSVQINALGAEEVYQVLNVIEFNSTRKRMSVVLRTPSGAIKLYSKGADTVILARLKPGRQPFVEDTQAHLQQFAEAGLRTLCLAVKQLTEAEYEAFAAAFDRASAALMDRDAQIDAVAETIENNLFLIGATAIEDKLQVGVPGTIATLKQAGIKIWVLTGDKQETAINIGYSCRLLHPGMALLICNEATAGGVQRWIDATAEALDAAYAEHQGTLENHALVIDGGSLVHVLQPEVGPRWLQLASRCKAVICCRVSPLQKAEVVLLVKRNTGAICLAIGDGANDVGMIQSANVGVGISGMEGLQAARSADYAIAQFRFLEKLLLCHGQWSLHRNTLLTLYFFYKNFSISFVQLFYQFVNGFSGQIIYEKWMMAAFNIMFVLLPPLAIGIFEQHQSKACLLAVPALYRQGQHGELYNTGVFWAWTLNAVLHCTLLYFLTFAAFATDVARSNGKTQGAWFFGCCLYAFAVYTCVLKAALHIRHWTWFTHLSIWGSLLLYLLFTLLYYNLYAMDLFGTMASEVYGLDQQIYEAPAFWALLLLLPVATLFPDYTYLAFRACFWPSMDEAVRQQDALGNVSAMAHGGGADGASERVEERQQYRHMGFAFSQDDGGGAVTQSQLIRAYDTDKVKPDGN